LVFGVGGADDAVYCSGAYAIVIQTIFVNIIE